MIAAIFNNFDNNVQYNIFFLLLWKLVETREPFLFARNDFETLEVNPEILEPK